MTPAGVHSAATCAECRRLRREERASRGPEELFRLGLLVAMGEVRRRFPDDPYGKRASEWLHGQRDRLYRKLMAPAILAATHG